jgi:hypothetical protein
MSMRERPRVEQCWRASGVWNWSVDERVVEVIASLSGMEIFLIFALMRGRQGLPTARVSELRTAAGRRCR